MNAANPAIPAILRGELSYEPLGGRADIFEIADNLVTMCCPPNDITAIRTHIHAGRELTRRAADGRFRHFV